MFATVLLILLFLVSIASLSYKNQEKLDIAYKKTINILKDIGLDIPYDKLKVVGVTSDEFKDMNERYIKGLSTDEQEIYHNDEQARQKNVSTKTSGCMTYSSDGKYEVRIPVDDTTAEHNLVRVLAHEVGGHVYQHSEGEIGKKNDKVMFNYANNVHDIEDVTRDYMKSKLFDDAESASFSNLVDNVSSKFDVYMSENNISVDNPNFDEIKGEFTVNFREKYDTPQNKLKYVENFIKKKTDEIEQIPSGAVVINSTKKAIIGQELSRNLDKLKFDIETNQKETDEKLDELNATFSEGQDIDSKEIYHEMFSLEYDRTGDTEKSNMSKDEWVTKKVSNQMDYDTAIDVLYDLESKSIESADDAIRHLNPLEEKYLKCTDKMKTLDKSEHMEEGWARSVEMNAIKKYIESECPDMSQEEIEDIIDSSYNSKLDVNILKSNLGIYVLGKEMYDELSGGDFEKQKEMALRLKSDSDLFEEYDSKLNNDVEQIQKQLKQLKKQEPKEKQEANNAPKKRSIWSLLKKNN